MNHDFARCRCYFARMINRTHLIGRSLHNVRNLVALSPHNTYIGSISLNFSFQRTERHFGLRAPGSCIAVIVCSASSNRQLGLSQTELERTRTQIFEDGYAVFPGMWCKADVEGVCEIDVGQAQEQVLRSFLLDPVGVPSQPRQLLHTPGNGCTDAASSPEPYWHSSWQIAGLEGRNLQRPPCSATLVVSLADRATKMFCGVAVFPRSHWIMNDRIAKSTSDPLPVPQPCDVPAATPVELRLDCGDSALLHPLLAYTVAPNVSSSSARFVLFNLGNATSNQVQSRVDEGEPMWRGWVSMADFPVDHSSTCVEDEMMQLQTEGEKAQLGGWQDSMTGMPVGQESLPTSLSARTAPRDILAWRLRNSAVQFMQDGQWSNALSMLLRRAGLRPTCYWTALQVPTPHKLAMGHKLSRRARIYCKAGRCCMKSAPAGQLAGRAGRKCTLEDGERFLLRAIEISPGWPIAYAELMSCLALMGRGREREIPRVMEMMKQCCKLEQLCLRYPRDADLLQESWNYCEAQCRKSLEL